LFGIAMFFVTGLAVGFMAFGSSLGATFVNSFR